MNSNSESLAKAVSAAAGQRLELSLFKIKHCLEQLDDEQLWWRPKESQNSIANILLHLRGNVGQWIIAGIGNKPDTRDRPREFSARGPMSKAELITRLEKTVEEAKQTLSGLTATELLENRTIQGFDVTVLEGIFDSVSHFTGHMQEIVSMTRTQLGDAYQFHWTPTGGGE